MRKLFLTLLFLSFTGLISCRKHSNVSATNFGTPHALAKQNTPDKNYCKGCGTSQSDLFHCAGRSCEENGPCEHTDALAYISNPTPAQIKETEDMYNVRDEFLINFELGQWYITYYYTLSRVSSENHLITKDNFPEYLDFGTDLLAATNVIRFGDPSEIPISATLQTKTMVFINRFRAVTKDPLVIGYLDNIEGDLNKFADKDVDFIRTEIGL